MKTVRTEHTFDCTPEEFWQVFFDDEIMNEVMAKIQIKERIVQHDEDDGLIRHRRIRQVPEREVPGALKKVMGDDMAYVEAQHFDKKAAQLQFTVEPSVMKDKTKISGSIRVYPEGSSRCRRAMEANVSVDIFVVGRIAEAFIADQIKEGYDKSVPHMRNAIADWKRANAAKESQQSDEDVESQEEKKSQ